MQQVVLGDTAVLSGPAAPAPRTGAVASGEAPQIDIRTVSLDQARAWAKFPIHTPTYRPSPTLTLARVHVVLAGMGGAREVVAVILKYDDSNGLWLVLRQSKIVAAGRLNVAGELTPGSVGDHPAAFLTFAVPTAAPPGQRTITRCYWEYNGMLMDLQAPELSAEILARVGASLA